MELRDHLVMAQWGKGLAHIVKSNLSRAEAFYLANQCRNGHDKKHLKCTSPTFFVMEIIGKSVSTPKPSLTKEQKAARRKEKTKFMAELSERMKPQPETEDNGD